MRLYGVQNEGKTEVFVDLRGGSTCFFSSESDKNVRVNDDTRMAWKPQAV